MFVFPKFQIPNMYMITPVIKVNEFPPGSLTIPRATPGIRTFSLPRGSGFRPTFFARGGGGFELEKLATVLKEKFRNSSICFKETGAV